MGVLLVLEDRNTMSFPSFLYNKYCSVDPRGVFFTSRPMSVEIDIWYYCVTYVLNYVYAKVSGDEDIIAEEILRKNLNNHLFIYGPQFDYIYMFGKLMGGGDPGWPINNQIGPILHPDSPVTHISIRLKHGNNLLMLFKLSH